MQNLIAVTSVLLVILPGSWWVSHTKLVGARTQVDAAWADVDAELQRRHDLVPALVTTVESAATHERELLIELARRNDTARRSRPDPATASRLEPPISDAIARVVALRERYPALDSQRNFLELQRELSLTEDRIAATRRYYNTRVEELNRRIEAFPSAIVARRHGFAKAAFFDV